MAFCIWKGSEAKVVTRAGVSVRLYWFAHFKNWLCYDGKKD